MKEIITSEFGTEIHEICELTATAYRRYIDAQSHKTSKEFIDMIIEQFPYLMELNAQNRLQIQKIKIVSEVNPVTQFNQKYMELEYVVNIEEPKIWQVIKSIFKEATTQFIYDLEHGTSEKKLLEDYNNEINLSIKPISITTSKNNLNQKIITYIFQGESKEIDHFITIFMEKLKEILNSAKWDIEYNQYKLMDIQTVQITKMY